MNKAIASTSILLLLGAAASSCTKELDFTYHDIEPILVVEAELTQSSISVELTETTPMDGAFSGLRLTDATVGMTDLTEGAAIDLQPEADGRYTAPGGGISGHEYMLTVERMGKKYSSICTMVMPCEILAMDFGWIKMPYDRVAVLQVSFTDPPESAGDCYWLRIYRNGMTYKWSPVTDASASDGIINVTMMTSRLDDIENPEETEELKDGDIISARLTPVSRTMHDYLVAIGADSSGPAMFSGDFCLGYFLAAPVAETATVFRSSEIPFD